MIQQNYLNQESFPRVMLKGVVPRLYQETILYSASQKDTLVVLPTGLGKTLIAIMLAFQRLQQFPSSKILVVAPTKPLVEQHYNSFKAHLDLEEDDFALFTGSVKPEKRGELWEKARIIASTPQGLENDIISKRVDLSQVSLVVFDEAHRATGDYSYVWLSRQYVKTARFPRILGLTASPGSDLEKITEVCTNLSIEAIEIRTTEDPDVKPYVKELDIEWVPVEFPESFKSVRGYLQDSFKSKLAQLKALDHINASQAAKMTRTELLSLNGHFFSEMSRGNKDFTVLKGISLVAEAMKVQHALELLETQGIFPLHSYLKRLESESRTSKVKAVKNLFYDVNFRSALIRTNSLFEDNIEHPKLGKLRGIVEEETKKGDVKIIIFNQFRDSAVRIKEELDSLGVSSKLFFGQAKKNNTGLSQKEQIAVLDEFRNNQFNCLICTSVAEEGLDIPAVDLVIFYEPIPSAIRTIQRRGRTGRQEKGRVMVLTTKDTRDEVYRWSAFHKERRMHSTLQGLKSKVSFLQEKPKESLDKFIKPDGPMIYVDDRERGSQVIKEIIDLGLDVKLKRLKVADYVLSERVAVEFKTVEDFVDSIIDNRLLSQVKELRGNYERPLMIVEGEADIYGVRKVHPNAIRGMMITISVSYAVPIIFTKNSKETALYLSIISRRESDDSKKGFSLHQERKPVTLREQQEYVVSSLPGVGPTLSKPLLEHFGSVKNIVDASEEELQGVEKIGKKKARGIRRVSDSKYD